MAAQGSPGHALAEKSLLYVYQFCNLGGVASVLKQRLPYLSKAGYAVDGLFTYDYGGRAGLEDAGVRHVTLSSDPLSHLALAAGQYDAICVVDMPDVARSLGQQKATPPLIYEIHSGMEGVVLRNDNEALLSARGIVVPSAWLKNVVRRHFPIVDDQRIHVCPNIVDATMFHPPAEGPGASRTGDVIWVGKIDEHKNWREAVAAMHLYFQEKAEPQGILVTGGRLNNRMMDGVLEELERRDLTRRIFWLHNVPYAAMPDVYRRVSRAGGLLLQCSKAESFGMVVHETARCGIPAVSRESGAVGEFVHHRVSGWLYRDGDIEGACRGLLELTSDAPLRTRVLEGISAQLKLYDPDLLGNQYVELLDRLIGQ